MRCCRLLILLLTLSCSGFSYAAECPYTNVNNVIQPSAEHDKDSICNSRDLKGYETLFYYSGEKAVCSDNKAIYCEAVKKERDDVVGGEHRLGSRITRDESRLALADQYWVKAFSFCGFNDYAAINKKYCDSISRIGATVGESTEQMAQHLEKNCTPKQFSSYVKQTCESKGGRSYSSNDRNTNIWCGNNYKNADPRAKKLAKEAPSKEVIDNNAPCEPRQIRFADSKSSTSSNSDKASNSSSSGSSSNTSNSGSIPKAPDTVDDALNKAKKLKDVFGF